MQRFVYSFVLFALVRSAPQTLDFEQSQLDTTADRTEFYLGDAMNNFSNELYSLLAQQNGGSIVISPFSIHTAMSMLYYGSPQDSNTNRQISSLLQVFQENNQAYLFNYLHLLNKYANLIQQYNTKIAFANRLYVDDTFSPKPNFQSVMRHFFRTTSEVVDFGDNVDAVQRINGFVNQKTNGLIPELLNADGVSGLTRMIVINAIYFKAQWKYQFDKFLTQSVGVFKYNGQQARVDMMNAQDPFNVGVANASELNAQVLELPYENEDFRMLVFLPKEDDGIEDMESRFRNFNMKSLRFIYEDTEVSLPKFKVSFRDDQMVQLFETLGVTDVFDPILSDLSDITDEPGAHISSFVHQAEIEVSEEGTEAAAASAGVLDIRSGSNNKRSFIVDHPFMFIVEDKARGIPLFMGRVVDPRGEWTLVRSDQQKRDNKSKEEEEAKKLLEGILAGPFPGHKDVVGDAEKEEIDEYFDVVPDKDSGEIGERQGSAQGRVPAPQKPCDEGYEEVTDPSISFPCKGHDTSVLEQLHEELRQEVAARQKRRMEDQS